MGIRMKVGLGIVMLLIVGLVLGGMWFSGQSGQPEPQTNQTFAIKIPKSKPIEPVPVHRTQQAPGMTEAVETRPSLDAEAPSGEEAADPAELQETMNISDPAGPVPAADPEPEGVVESVPDTSGTDAGIAGLDPEQPAPSSPGPEKPIDPMKDGGDEAISEPDLAAADPEVTAGRPDEDGESTAADRQPAGQGDVQEAVVSAAPAGPMKLHEVRMSENLKGKILEIWASERVEAYRYFILSNPPRLVIDLPGNWEEPEFQRKEIGNDLISRIRTWRHPTKLRIVCDLVSDRTIQPEVTPNSEGVEFLLVTD